MEHCGMLPATFDRATLPDAVEPLQELVMELAHALQALRDQVSEQMARLAHQLADLRRRLYGARSEVLHVRQGELWSDTVEVPLPPEQFDDVARHRRRRTGRPAIDASVPRRRVEHDLSDEDKAQYRSVQRIGEEVVETLEYTPARLEVLQHARLKYRCEDAHGTATIRTASAQPSPIAKCNAGAGLLAQVLVAKYADHLPLARQERIFARHGASLSRQTLCDWALASAELLRPLMAPLHQHVLSCPVIFADDTKLALHPGRGSHRGKTIAARLWAYVAGGARRDEHGRWQVVAPAALYDFTCSRAGEHPRRILQGWSGYLQADDLSAHQALFRSGAITHCGCWAHARRRYEAIVKTAPKRSPPGLAHEALRFIGELYRVERETALANPDERQRQRQQRTRPLLDDMLRWLQQHAPTVLPKSPLGQAFGYTLSNWDALTVFLDAGMVLADNNTCERGMRPVAVSRKNWLFAGSERGGHAAAVAFSLIETAKLNAVEPYAYLKDVLSRINDHRCDRLVELLPMHWKPA
jgi:transposase